MVLYSYAIAHIVMVAILWINTIGQSSACEELKVCCCTLQCCRRCCSRFVLRRAIHRQQHPARTLRECACKGVLRRIDVYGKHKNVTDWFTLNEAERKEVGGRDSWGSGDDQTERLVAAADQGFLQ